MVTQICVRSRVRAAGAVMELSDYSLEKLRTDGEFLLYRGRHARPTQASEPSVLVLTTVLEHPEPASIRRLEHEFSLREELDPAWAALFADYPDRFMIGTDTWVPSQWTRLPGLMADVRSWLRQLPPELAAAIAFGNAERVLTSPLTDDRSLGNP